MGTKGIFALVLHAHLPYVRHPEHERFLEEDWLYEAVTESYLPLLETFENLLGQQVPFKISLVLTPTLLHMWQDPLLQQRYVRHIERLIELAEHEVHRTSTDDRFHSLARLYLERFRWARHAFVDTYHCNLIEGFRRLQQEGCLEIFSSAATHAFLPYLQEFPLAVLAQIRCALQAHCRILGKAPRGFWLPECGYYEGLDQLLADQQVQTFITDAHGVLHATPRALHGVFAPILTPSGVAVFGRDIESSRQVWSSREGYPGDFFYREFYRDIGFDLDLDYVRPYVQPTGERKNTGIKYYRITGPTAEKLPYLPHVAAQRVQEHARHFANERILQIAQVQALMPNQSPIVVSPYDAELFGHWWFEGPQFLGLVLRELAASGKIECLSPLDYLERTAQVQVASPAASSWGQNGFGEVWLNPTNDWIYAHLHHTTEQMLRQAAAHGKPNQLTRRALNQASRELLLAQSSDWAFMMKMGTTVEYARQRTQDHLLACQQLLSGIADRHIDQPLLARLEQQNNVFPDMDYRVFRSDYRTENRQGVGTKS